MHVEQVVPVLCHEGQINFVRPNERSISLSIQRSHLEVDVSKIEVVFWIDDITHDLDSAVVRIEHGVRVLLLHDDLEVVGSALVPNTVRGEDQLLGGVLVSKEWWVFLVLHLGNIELWLIVFFLINQLWKLIVEVPSNFQLKTGLNLSLEVWIGVLFDVDAEIQLGELV